MSYPWPKILTEITVPTGGWRLDLTVSVAAQFDTPIFCTVPAGTYFISWDWQSDDLLYALHEVLDAAVNAVDSHKRATLFIDGNNKVNFFFYGRYIPTNSDGFVGNPDRDVRIDWTAGTTSADLAAALGFDNSADDSSTGVDRPIITADWPHSHAWYANAGGQLKSLRAENISTVDAQQAVDYAGRSIAKRMGKRYTNDLSLQWLPCDLTFSRGVGYGEAAVEPYTRNKGLESWWREAAQGKRFRVYREGRNGTDGHFDTVEVSISSASWLTLTKTLETDPQEYRGMLFYLPDWHSIKADMPARFYIASNTSSAVYSANDSYAFGWWYNGDATCYVVDGRYDTYVVDLARMSAFEPQEIVGVDYYNIDIPLIRYEA